MSRYKPTPAQIRALRAIAARRVVRSSVGPHKDSHTGETYPRTTVRRLLLEELVEARTQYGDLFTLTLLGESLLATLDGAS